jgi:hypothetical protein
MSVDGDGPEHLPTNLASRVQSELEGRLPPRRSRARALFPHVASTAPVLKLVKLRRYRGTTRISVKGRRRPIIIDQS